MPADACSCGCGPKVGALGRTYKGRPITCCYVCWHFILQLLDKEAADAPVRL